MTEPDPDDVIDPGWDVRDTDGVLLGQVDDATSRYVVVDRSETGAPALYIPAGAVEAAGGMEVRLDMSAADLPALGWDAVPDDLYAEDEAAPVVATPEEVERAEEAGSAG